MKGRIVAAVVYLCLSSTMVWGQEAMEFYNRGLKSSLAYKQIEYFTMALELNPKLSAAYEKRGKLYYFRGKYNEMIEDFLKVTELKPFEPEAYRMLGLGYMKKGNLDEAIANLTRALELDPQLASAYFQRAEAYRLQGMAAAAIRDSTKAIELGGSEQFIVRAYATRAKSHRDLGQSEAAKADFKIASSIASEYYINNSPLVLLAELAAESSRLKRVGWIGIFGIIAVVFVVVFKLALSAPRKGGDS